MRLLLDTHIILWVVANDARLSDKARKLLQIPREDVFYSVASLWEIGIKHGYGRLEFSPLVISDAMNRSGFVRLPIKDDHIERLLTLPHHHRDPFDRMLVAQADSEPLKLVTSDSRLEAYGTAILMV